MSTGTRTVTCPHCGTTGLPDRIDTTACPHDDLGAPERILDQLAHEHEHVDWSLVEGISVREAAVWAKRLREATIGEGA